jgi:NAD(P)-dependent dehydrogenase (short-subunit alcohol dehydrogenase family)
MQVAIATGASSGIGASAVMQIAKWGRGAPDLRHERIRTRDTVEADGGTATALPLDVGRSETFPAFRELPRGDSRETARGRLGAAHELPEHPAASA